MSQAQIVECPCCGDRFLVCPGCSEIIPMPKVGTEKKARKKSPEKQESGTADIPWDKILPKPAKEPPLVPKTPDGPWRFVEPYERAPVIPLTPDRSWPEEQPQPWYQNPNHWTWEATSMGDPLPEERSQMQCRGSGRPHTLYHSKL